MSCPADMTVRLKARQIRTIFFIIVPPFKIHNICTGLQISKLNLLEAEVNNIHPQTSRNL